MEPKLVGIEPSCILGFVGDFPDLASNKNKAYEISENTMLIEEFLLHHFDTKNEVEFSNPPKNKKALFHGHCHQKALVGTSPAMQLLNRIPGLETTEINSGCCGMAGSFGFDKSHYDISMDIGEMTLFPRIREESDDVIIISEGVSCRQQIQEGTKRNSKHIVQILADYI
ncbi:MAG: (Fe-S)-binding protein [Dehalococcoidia bacterium]